MEWLRNITIHIDFILFLNILDSQSVSITVVHASDLIILIFIDQVLVHKQRLEYILAGLNNLLVLLLVFKLLIVHVYIVEKHILLLLNWIILNLVINNRVQIRKLVDLIVIWLWKCRRQWKAFLGHCVIISTARLVLPNACWLLDASKVLSLLTHCSLNSNLCSETWHYNYLVLLYWQILVSLHLIHCIL